MAVLFFTELQLFDKLPSWLSYSNNLVYSAITATLVSVALLLESIAYWRQKIGIVVNLTLNTVKTKHNDSLVDLDDAYSDTLKEKLNPLSKYRRGKPWLRIYVFAPVVFLLALLISYLVSYLMYF
jgi:hypothetical protein